MKKVMIMVMALVVMFGFAATVNAADEKEIKDYIAEQNGTEIETVDDFFIQELINNSCRSVDIDGEKVDLKEEGTLVTAYAKEGCRTTFVIFEYEDSIVVVDTDNAKAKEL